MAVIPIRFMSQKLAVRSANYHRQAGDRIVSGRPTGMPRPPRVFYVAGPGAVAGDSYEHWKDGVNDPHEVALTYSGQFFDICRDLGSKAEVISTHPQVRGCSGTARSALSIGPIN